MGEREIIRTFEGMETMDGAGVRLVRLFANREARLFDPFLLLDLFGSEDPDQYLPGFPWHPHRGIETVTYMLGGSVRHGDSMGNSGFIGPGDVQWMTAGSGIVHEEMPQPSPIGIRGFQLWVNLPHSEKMRAPTYRGFGAGEIPIETVEGGEVRAIAGSLGGARGPVQGLARQPTYFDIRLGDEGSIELRAPEAETAFACVYEGSLATPALPAGARPGRLPLCCLFGRGDRVRVKAGPSGCSFVFARGTPIGEDIAWRGPIVMNTQAELDLAFREYAEGSFVKAKAR
jgi:hypothetical protein